MSPPFKSCHQLEIIDITISPKYVAGILIWLTYPDLTFFRDHVIFQNIFDRMLVVLFRAVQILKIIDSLILVF